MINPAKSLYLSVLSSVLVEDKQSSILITLKLTLKNNNLSLFGPNVISAVILPSYMLKKKHKKKQIIINSKYHYSKYPKSISNTKIKCVLDSCIKIKNICLAFNNKLLAKEYLKL